MVYLQGWLKDRFSGSSVFLMTFHASNNEFSQFSLQYEPSTINKSSSRVWKLSAIFWLFPPTYSTCFKQTMGLLSNNCRSNRFQMVLRKAADILAWFLQTICGSIARLFCSDQVKHLQLIWGQGAKDVNSCCTYCNSAEHSANHQLMVDMRRRTPDNLAEP